MAGVTGIFERISFLLQKSLFVFHGHRFSFCGIYLKEHQVDFLKVRAALGQTGNDANVYKTTSWYQIANFKDINGYYTSMPIGGVMGMTSNNTLPSSSLKPEMTTEYEFGLSGSFLETG